MHYQDRLGKSVLRKLSRQQTWISVLNVPVAYRSDKREYCDIGPDLSERRRPVKATRLDYQAGRALTTNRC